MQADAGFLSQALPTKWHSVPSNHEPSDWAVAVSVGYATVLKKHYQHLKDIK